MTVTKISVSLGVAAVPEVKEALQHALDNPTHDPIVWFTPEHKVWWRCFGEYMNTEDPFKLCAQGGDFSVSNVYYCSDLHFDHRFMAQWRGFSAATERDGVTPEEVQAHNAAIVDAWCSVVKPNDIVWFLGDLAVSSPKHALEIVSSLPGRKRIIWGNHDEGHPMHKDAVAKTGKYLEVFEWAGFTARRKVDGVEFLMNHMPFHFDHTADVRFEQWRLPDLGANLIHGHTHSKVIATSATEYHVGWDSHFAMVPEQQIVEYFKRQNALSSD